MNRLARRADIAKPIGLGKYKSEAGPDGGGGGNGRLRNAIFDVEPVKMIQTGRAGRNQRKRRSGNG